MPLGMFRKLPELLMEDLTTAEIILLQEINVSCFLERKYLVEAVSAMDHGVRQTKQMQRSSTSISRTLQQHLQAETLTVQPTSFGGSAARAATTATFSTLPARAAPALTARAAVMASMPRSAFTDIFIPFL